jgi:RNA polymerase sigma factor (TIGR02999 family)
LPSVLSIFLSRISGSTTVNDLTLLLNRITSGNMAAGQLLPLVYQELRQLAAQKMAREAPGQTLQATALVHEAWLRVGGEAQSWQSRAHFFGAAAEAMRRILIDRARRKRAARHGGGLDRVGLDDVEIAAPVEENELMDVHEALDEFASRHAQKAALVKLRYFAGLTIEEAAEVLGISVPTATRHWAFARVWLFREISRRKGQRG